MLNCVCVCVCGWGGNCVWCVGVCVSIPSHPPHPPAGWEEMGGNVSPKNQQSEFIVNKYIISQKKKQKIVFVRILGSCYCEGQRLAASCVDSPLVDPQGGGPHPQGGEPDACTFRRLTHLGCLVWLPRSRDPIAMQASGIR